MDLYSCLLYTSDAADEGLGVDHFTKVVAGKQLWNYDNLEPTEKKLIL